MPIEGAHVEVFKDGVLVAEGYTDADGKWTQRLLAGTYHIIVSKTGYTTIEKTETLVRRTDLIVNLPTFGVEAVGRSGVVAPYIEAGVINPEIWCIIDTPTPTSKACAITCVHQTSVT